MHKWWIVMVGLIYNAQTYADVGTPHVTLKHISKTQFVTAEKKAPRQKPPEAITDINKVRELLKGLVVFGKSENTTNIDNTARLIQQVTAKNGTILYAQESMGGQVWFKAYYPSVRYLSVDTDYEADNGYDLNLGQDPDVIGHAANFFDAPNRQYRITGAYNGQECYDYKLLHHIGDTPWNIIYSIDMDDACHFSHQFWTDNSHFYYSVMQPQGNKTVMRYYQLSITSLK